MSVKPDVNLPPMSWAEWWSLKQMDLTVWLVLVVICILGAIAWTVFHKDE